MSIDYNKWLEILCFYLTGVLAKITNEIWEVESDLCGHDFEFTCRLGDFVRGTRNYDFTSPKLYEGLLIDAHQIASVCERETGKVKVIVQDFHMIKKMLFGLREK